MSVGDRTQYTTVNVKKKKQVNWSKKKKSYSVSDKFTSLIDVSKLEKN